MSFKLVSIDEEKIVLSKNELAIIPFVMLSLFGLVFLTTGIWMFWMCFTNHPNSSFAAASFMVFFGLVPFVAVLWLVNDHVKHIKHMIFRLKVGFMELHSSSKIPQMAFVPFSHFKELEISKGYVKSGKKYRECFYLHLHRKDGEKWLLFESESQDFINQQHEKLSAVLNLGLETSGIPKPVLSPNLIVSNTKDLDAAEWKLFDWTTIVYSAIFVIVLGLLLAFLDSSGNLYSVFGAFWGFIFILFLCSFLYSLQLLINKMDVLFGISISATDVCFYEKSTSGRMLKSDYVPIANIHSVTNSMNDNMTTKNISLYIHEKDNLTTENLSAFQKIKQKIKGLHHLYFSNLTFVESLELERWIQERIKERSGVEVL
jgi:hypothetical protein